MSTRVRLTPDPICGRVIEWKGAYGWIEPQCSIEHPDISKHRGRIFVHSEDCVPKWRSLTVGVLVEFHLYYDGQGLGAEDCEARKVLRLTLSWDDARSTFGEEGEQIPEFEQRFRVTMRAYQWEPLDDGALQETWEPGHLVEAGLPFLLFEVWGRPLAIVEAVLEAASFSSGSQRHCGMELLVPETRLWKVRLGQLRQRCRSTELSQELAISDPMPCRTLAIRGTREECGAAVQAFLAQVCD